nr:hypothetical protein CTI12_AA358980 [Tanacetum cinerariifolium]
YDIYYQTPSVWLTGYDETQEGTITSIDGSVDDKGYEKDVGESLKGDVDSLDEEQKGNDLLTESHLDENRSKVPAITLYDKEKEGSGVVKVNDGNMQINILL